MNLQKSIEKNTVTETCVCVSQEVIDDVFLFFGLLWKVLSYVFISIFFISRCFSRKYIVNLKRNSWVDNGK